MKFRDPYEDKKPPRRDDDDREKPSWSEIDSKRNRGFYTQKEFGASPDQKPKRDTRREEALAKKALGELFMGKKSKEAEEAWKHVSEGRGKVFSRRANAYVEKFGMPRQWDDLLELLDHDSPEFVGTVLDQMMDLAPNETPKRRDLLVGKLRIIKMTLEEPRILEKIETSQATLKGLS